MSPLLFWLIPRALINSSSRPHPTPPRLPGPSFKNLPVNMSLSCWQNQQVIGLSLPWKRATFQIAVPSKQWLWQYKMLSPDSEAIWGRSKVRSKVQWPLGRVCPGLQMTSKGNPYLPACRPVQLLSPSRSTESEFSLGFILLYSRKVIYELDYRHLVSRKPFSCLRSLKRMTLLCSLGWHLPLSVGMMEKSDQKTRECPEALLSKSRSIRLKLMKLLVRDRLILQNL